MTFALVRWEDEKLRNTKPPFIRWLIRQVSIEFVKRAKSNRLLHALFGNSSHSQQIPFVIININITTGLNEQNQEKLQIFQLRQSPAFFRSKPKIKTHNLELFIFTSIFHRRLQVETCIIISIWIRVSSLVLGDKNLFESIQVLNVVKTKL